MSSDQATRDYVARRQAEGETKSEAIRCLMRHIAREVYNALPKQAIA
jgi:transposase